MFYLNVEAVNTHRDRPLVSCSEMSGKENHIAAQVGEHHSSIECLKLIICKICILFTRTKLVTDSQHIISRCAVVCCVCSFRTITPYPLYIWGFAFLPPFLISLSCNPLLPLVLIPQLGLSYEPVNVKWYFTLKGSHCWACLFCLADLIFVITLLSVLILRLCIFCEDSFIWLVRSSVVVVLVEAGGVFCPVQSGLCCCCWLMFCGWKQFLTFCFGSVWRVQQFFIFIFLAVPRQMPPVLFF